MKKILNRKIVISLVFGIFYASTFIIGKSIYNTNGLVSLYSSPKAILKTIVLFLSVLVLSSIGLYIIIAFLNKHKTNTKRIRISDRKLFFLLFLIILLVYSTALLSLYPGVFSYDTMHVNRQALGVLPYDRFQPPLFSYLWYICVVLANLSGFETSTVYAILQLVFVSIVFSCYLVYLKRKNTNLFVVSSIFVIFNPVFALFAIIPVKDVPFSLFFGLSVIMIYESMKKNNATFTLGRKIILATSIILASLLRNNAVYVYIVFFILYLIIYKNKYKQTSLIIFLSILSFFVINGPVYNVLGVASGNQREKLSVPIEQISLVVNRNKDTIDEKTKEDISSFFYDYDSIDDLYNPRFVDDVKELFYSDYYNEHKIEFFKMYINLFEKYPNEFVVSFLDLNIPMWYQNANSIDPYSKREYIEINVFENLFSRESKLPVLQKYYEGVASFRLFEKIPPIINIFSINFPFWLLIICLFVNIYNKNHKNVTILMLILLLWLTYLLGPVSNCRYVLPFMMLYPFLLKLMFDKDENAIILGDEKDI